MSSDRLYDAVALLASGFPRTPLPPATVDLYVRMLQDLPVELVEAAIVNAIRTETWPPTIGEIRERVAERTLQLPSVAEAVEAFSRETLSPSECHPLVWRARSAVGDGWRWRTEERPGLLISEARKVYEALRAETIRRHQLGELDAAAELVRPALPPGVSSAESWTSDETALDPNALQRFRELASRIGRRIPE